MFFLLMCLQSLFIHCPAAGNAVYGRAAEGLLQQEKDVFRQLSTHFGSVIYLKSWRRRWREPVSCHCSYPHKECVIQYLCIHSLRGGQTDGIFSDIMNLTDCVGFSDSLVIPQQVKTRSGVYLTHGEIGIGGN